MVDRAEKAEREHENEHEPSRKAAGEEHDQVPEPAREAREFVDVIACPLCPADRLPEVYMLGREVCELCLAELKAVLDERRGKR